MDKKRRAVKSAEDKVGRLLQHWQRDRWRRVDVHYIIMILKNKKKLLLNNRKLYVCLLRCLSCMKWHSVIFNFAMNY